MLTKTRYRQGSSCPTKLYFASKGYKDTREASDFMETLAEGGYQVGALAKCYYPQGIEINERDPMVAVARTKELLAGDKNVELFEAAFEYDGLLARADVLLRFNGKYYLKEVKAKSWDPVEDSFIGKRGGITAEWRDHLQDLAFQRYVISNALKAPVNTAFMFVDKNNECLIDGLFQMFVVKKDENNRKGVRVDFDDLPDDFWDAKGRRLLIDVYADEVLDRVVADHYDGKTWKEHVYRAKEIYETSQWQAPVLGAQCSGCEYAEARQICWQEKNGIDIERPLVLDLKHYRSRDKRIKEGVFYVSQMLDEEFEMGGEAPNRLIWQRDNVEVCDRDGYWEEHQNWRYPLNFIDFETCAPAIPLFKGMKPYQTMAFQFSHHIWHADGRLEHFEFLHDKQTMPNYEFVRALKRSLEQNKGEIFRWHNHENTVLNIIENQLWASNEPDKVELCEFIQTITRSKESGGLRTVYIPPTGSSKEGYWAGPRNMIDQYVLASKYYYHPKMHGSWSVKKVMDSISPTDPYKELPHITISGLELTDELFTDLTDLKDGGTAMIAYLHCQNPKMGNAERQAIFKALLNYCHLDTLSMVNFHKYML